MRKWVDVLYWVWKKKLKLLKDYEENSMKSKQLSAKYKVDKSTVYKIIKNSAKIKKVSNSWNLKTLRQRKGDHPDIEKALPIWFNEMRGQNAVVTGLMLSNKAKEFAVNLEKDFEPNTSWLFRWKKRNRICVGKNQWGIEEQWWKWSLKLFRESVASNCSRIYTRMYF